MGCLEFLCPKKKKAKKEFKDDNISCDNKGDSPTAIVNDKGEKIIIMNNQEDFFKQDYNNSNSSKSRDKHKNEFNHYKFKSYNYNAKNNDENEYKIFNPNSERMTNNYGKESREPLKLKGKNKYKIISEEDLIQKDEVNNKKIVINESNEKTGEFSYEKDFISRDNELIEYDKNFNKKRNDLIEKEIDNNLKIENEKDLIDRESINNKEIEYNKKLKEVNNKEKEYIEKLNYVNIKEKKLEEKENNLNIKEDKNKKKEEELKKRENNINIKEQNYRKKENDLKDKEILISNKEKEIQMKDSELNKRENLLNAKDEEFKRRDKELSERQNLLNKQEKELEKKLGELDREKEKGPIIVGLKNIGATCYMNATLQALSNTDKLTEHFLYTYKYNSEDKSKIMSNELYKVITNLWDRKNNKSSYSPNEFKEVLSIENTLFAGIAANDSKDLINFLLERIHTELNIIKKDINSNNNNYIITQNDQWNEQRILQLFLQNFSLNYNSIISNLFYGVLETKSQCQGCKTMKYNFQIYSFIEFPLEEVNNYCFNTGKRNNFNYNNTNKNPDVDLYECFEYYSKIETMTGSNQMYCNKCNCNCDALYGSSIFSAPNYLIINLNRGKDAKYECKVNFPELLNILNFVSYKQGNTVFELYAVISHHGPSSMSGHFVAYCKNIIDKKWYLFNDELVSLCQNRNDYQRGMSYILFYRAIQI